MRWSAFQGSHGVDARFSDNERTPWLEPRPQQSDEAAAEFADDGALKNRCLDA